MFELKRRSPNGLIYTYMGI